MAGNQIDNTGAGPSLPIGPPPPPAATPPPSSTPETNTTSSIAPSDIQQDLVVHNAATPTLEASSKFLADYQKKLESITSDLLEKWLESIEEEAKRIREELRSPKYLAFLKRNKEFQDNLERADMEARAMNSPSYIEWVASLAPRDRDMELFYKNVVGSQVETIQTVGNSVERAAAGQVNSAQSISLLAASFAIGTTNIGEVITAKELGQAADMNSSVFRETWQQVGSPLGIEQRPDILGQIGAWMMVSLTAKTIVNSIDPSNAGEQVKPKQSAEEFAKLVMQLVMGKDKDMNIEKEVKNAQQPEGGSSRLKVAFLAEAIAYLYAAQAGKITSTEFAAMLKPAGKPGAMTLTGTLASLSVLLQKELSEIPEDQREELIYQLLDWVDSKPKLGEKMAEASRLYSSLMQTMPSPRPIEG